MSFISQFSLAGESQFWRVEGKGSVKTTCGGVVSLILILSILTIFGFKIAEVLRMETIFVTEEREADLHMKGNITTFQN